MLLPQPLLRGTLARRYKRFLADVVLETGETVTAHCANPGSMWGLKEPGLGVWVSRNDDPKRKLNYSLELVRDAKGVLAGINTGRPNALVAEALASDGIAELTGYAQHRREVKYRERSRVDFVLSSDGRADAYVEVKNVHMQRVPGLVEFPDSVTARGTKHMGDLAAMAGEGHRAVVLFVIQMEGAERFDLARDIDPGYAEAFDAARAMGVEALAYACAFTPPDSARAAITLDRAIPIVNCATDI